MDYDYQLSDFQRKVLTTITEIPFGETRTYQWVAQKIGKPKASRAVGQALRRNPYLIVYPCHRVIRSDGSLASYAGGSAKRKEELINFERQVLQRRKKSSNNSEINEHKAAK